MEWQQILGFYHVARLGSFTKAAEATLRTQSALSQQIKALEEELACPLFERLGKRQIRLTPTGEKFYRFSQEIIERQQRLLEEINEEKGLARGHLRLAAPFTTLYHLFPQVLEKFIRQYSQVQLKILDRSQESVIDLIKNGEIDFGFVLEAMVPKNLACRRWHKVDMVLLTPEDHPLTTLPQVSWRDIARYPLILPPPRLKHNLRQDLEENFRKIGADYRVVMESSNVELTAVYVEMGVGISLTYLAQDLPLLRRRKLAYLSLSKYFPPDYIALVWRPAVELSAYKQAFVRILLQEPGDLAFS
jgi:DNA-binding transcriptional LysR family regulator